MLVASTLVLPGQDFIYYTLKSGSPFRMIHLAGGPHLVPILKLWGPVLESDAEPGGEKFVQLGAWENAYFATRSKSRQKRVNCIILANLCNL